MNPTALGNSWFVQNWKIVANADAEMQEMDSLNTATTAVIDQRYAEYVKDIPSTFDSTSSIKLKDGGYSPNKLNYVSNSNQTQLAVFSEVYYPAGWNAYIDGKPTEHIRLNYALRGLKIPSGKHEIEFKFEPKVYYQGEQIALAGSIALLLLVAGAGFIELKNSGSKKENSNKG
jgi:uncharacterized membrane protein YfhO